MSANVPATSIGPVPESVPQQSWGPWLVMIARAVNCILRGEFTALSLTLGAITSPPTPSGTQFRIYMDLADNKLKAIGPSGTITDIANP